MSGLLSSGTKKDAELIGRPIKHKNNAEPKNKLGPASRWQGQKDLNPRHAVLETAALPTELYPYFKILEITSNQLILNLVFYYT